MKLEIQGDFGDSKYAYLQIKDVPPKHAEGIGAAQTDREPSSLDMALRRLKEKGARVLDYRRGRGHWIFKVMVPKVAA